MKNLFLLAAASSLFFTLTFCKNTPMPEGRMMVSDQMPVESAPLPMGNVDSVAGFKGCERATWSPLSADSEEFVYQHYTVKVTQKTDTKGEKITVVRDSGRADFVIPMPENGYFRGISRNKLFVDAVTDAEGRQLFVFDVDKNLQYFSTRYCGEPEIHSHEKIYFLLPVKEEEVEKMPDCPEKEEWLKNDLRVGYGQRAIFNLPVRMLTRKSEWVCVPEK